MSISVIISNPKTEYERSFCLPVSSESFFRKIWLPITLELGLKWVPLFQTGVEIQKCDLEYLFEELNNIKNFDKEKLRNKNGDHLLSRIELINRIILELFDRDDLTIYIG